MMRRDECLKVLARHRSDEIVVAVYQAAQEWIHISPSDLNYTFTGAMGQGSSHALGLALGRPDKRVVVLDGDGSLLMNLGSMVTLSNKAPRNLYHFLFQNGVYAVTGGQPVPGAGNADWEKMAAGAGYAATFSFDNLEDLTTGIDEVLAARGPVFMHLAIVPQIENTPLHLRQRARRNVQVAIRELPEALGSA